MSTQDNKGNILIQLQHAKDQLDVVIYMVENNNSPIDVIKKIQTIISTLQQVSKKILYDEFKDSLHSLTPENYAQHIDEIMIVIRTANRYL